MLKKIIRDHQLYVKNIEAMEQDINNQLKELSFYYSMNPNFKIKIKLKMPLYFKIHEYFQNNNYLFFKDFFNIECQFITKDNYVEWLMDLSYLEKNMQIKFLNTIEDDIKNIFKSIKIDIDIFYKNFELLLAENYNENFVIDYIEHCLLTNNIKNLSLLNFIPYINIFERIGLICDFNEVLSVDNSFALYTGDRIKFVSRVNIVMESFKLQQLREDNFDDFNPEVKSWLKSCIHNLNIFSLPYFASNFMHIKDYLNSEDVIQIIPILKKIGLQDMIGRSQKWLDRIENTHLKEKTEDTQEIVKYNNFRIVRLLTTHSLDRESSYLKHCIGRGSYDKYIYNDASKLYSVRNHKNEPVATIEVGFGVVIQLQGFKNSWPDPSVKPIVLNFIKQNNLLIKDENIKNFLHNKLSSVNQNSQ